jgi:hypothetical protein
MSDIGPRCVCANGTGRDNFATGTRDTIFADSFGSMAPANACYIATPAERAKADNIILVCKSLYTSDYWTDCNKYLKAVARNVGVVIPQGPNDNADVIANFVRNAKGWIQLPTDDHGASAIEAARHGQFVVANMASGELGAAHGHVAVVVSDNAAFSGKKRQSYPRAYWGTLGGAGGADQILTESFGVSFVDAVRYSSTSTRFICLAQ